MHRASHGVAVALAAARNWHHSANMLAVLGLQLQWSRSRIVYASQLQSLSLEQRNCCLYCGLSCFCHTRFVLLPHLYRPLASALNAQLGNITQILTLSGPNVQMGLNGVLQQLQGVAASLINGTSGALGLPPIPGLPPLPALPALPGLPGLPGIRPNSTLANFALPFEIRPNITLPPLPQLPSLPPLPPLPGLAGIRPNGSLANLTLPIGIRPNHTLPHGIRPNHTLSHEHKPHGHMTSSSKPHSGKQKEKSKDTKGQGRHLLQSSNDVPLPLLEVAFTIPELGSLSGDNGTSFDPVAFRQAVVNGVEAAVNSFANDFVGSVLGLRGVSQMDGVNTVMQSLSTTVNGAVAQLRESAAGLPKGPVFEFLTTGDKEALQPLKQLQQTLVAAFDGSAENSTAIDAAELAALFNRASSTLQALGGPVQQVGRTANSGDVVKRFAQQFTTVADAAGKMLDGMKSNLRSWSSQVA